MKEEKVQEARPADMNAAVLFISYDGMTDPLGGSQILPYIRSIATHPRQVHILSFEKPERYAADGVLLQNQLVKEGIHWTPLMFTRGGKLAKLWDLGRMYAAALKLAAMHRFRITHCRSYQAAQVGRLLKHLFGMKLLFDMRGLWVDERIDGGIWSMDRAIDRLAYRHYKRVERGLIEGADHVVALTHRVVPELEKLAPNMNSGVTVIPCCADFSHFHVATEDEKSLARRGLGIPRDAFVLCYLGSLGTWYCLDEMLDVFRAAAHLNPDAHMLLITRDWQEEHMNRFQAKCGSDLVDRLHVCSASRNDVPRLLGAADAMISFIKPAYSKMASSPTKLAESFACGIPAICNPGIGDVDGQLTSLQAGALLDLTESGNTETVSVCLSLISSMRGIALREKARAVLDLPVAASSYREIYRKLELQ